MRSTKRGPVLMLYDLNDKENTLHRRIAMRTGKTVSVDDYIIDVEHADIPNGKTTLNYDEVRMLAYIHCKAEANSRAILGQKMLFPHDTTTSPATASLLEKKLIEVVPSRVPKFGPVLSVPYKTMQAMHFAIFTCRYVPKYD